jgi:hypothetical protein
MDCLSSLGARFIEQDGPDHGADSTGGPVGRDRFVAVVGALARQRSLRAA